MKPLRFLGPATSPYAVSSRSRSESGSSGWKTSRMSTARRCAPRCHTSCSKESSKMRTRPSCHPRSTFITRIDAPSHPKRQRCALSLVLVAPQCGVTWTPGSSTENLALTNPPRTAGPAAMTAFKVLGNRWPMDGAGSPTCTTNISDQFPPWWIPSCCQKKEGPGSAAAPSPDRQVEAADANSARSSSAMADAAASMPTVQAKELATHQGRAERPRRNMLMGRCSGWSSRRRALACSRSAWAAARWPASRSASARASTTNTLSGATVTAARKWSTRPSRSSSSRCWL
mmetsp:Transcript_66362/g.177667  ORF Transcript_66362/g.177667 Transcript_66362/m.177667 type:complete len:287 (-) Transcript_66362:521-1381(-)